MTEACCLLFFLVYACRFLLGGAELQAPLPNKTPEQGWLPAPLDRWAQPRAVSSTFYWVDDRQMVPESVFKAHTPHGLGTDPRVLPGLLAKEQHQWPQPRVSWGRSRGRGWPGCPQLW